MIEEVFMLFSIITVSYNVKDEIKKTIDSVLQQTYLNYEYIIIDGASSDVTKDVADSFKSKFIEKKIKYVIVSEKDFGIYNAMNKGIKLAKGEWLLFLNAGDFLCHSSVLEKVSACICNSTGIMYGQVFYKLYDLYKYVENFSLNEIKSKMVFCHQSTFISRKIMLKYKYDEQYKIAADYDFFLKCYVKKEEMSRIPFPISVFQLGGVSSQGGLLQQKELAEIRHNHGVLSDEEYMNEIAKINKNKKVYMIKDIFRKCIPQKILQLIRVKTYVRGGYSTDLEKLIEEYYKW